MRGGAGGAGRSSLRRRLETATPAERGAVIRARLAEARVGAFDATNRGLVIAERLWAAADGGLRALFHNAPEAHPAAAAGVAIVAQGGYGRGVLAPHSDLDLLILTKRGGEAAAGPFLDALLYPLWDAGLKVGHAVRAPSDAVAFAREDMTGRTALLDMRYLAGDEARFEKLQKRFEALRAKSAKAFIAAKLAERERRIEKAETSRYLLEPDVKEGKGGLRDLHLLAWLGKYAFELRSLDDGVQEGVLTEAEARAYQRAVGFLWSVRVHLHDIRGRADERLAYDVQPALAERLGYVDRGVATAAERFMRHYFLTTKTVGGLTRSVVAAIEARTSPKSAARLKPAPARVAKVANGHVVLRDGRLDFAEPRRAMKDAAAMVALFRAVARGGADVHPHAMRLVSDHRRIFNGARRRDPELGAMFLAAVLDPEAGARAARLMAEAGLLGAMVPAFGRIEGGIEYGLFRRHTLDEHAVRGIEALASIRAGAREREHPVATRLLARGVDPAPIALALLLQDAAFARHDATPDRAARLVRAVAKRLDMTPEAADRAAYLVADGRRLSRTAERRDVSDPLAVQRFADAVGTEARLDSLLVFTVCVRRASGEHMWDGWRRKQITVLHRSAHAYFAGGVAGRENALARRRAAGRLAVARRMADWPEAAREDFFARVGEAFWLQTEPEVAVRAADLMRAAEQAGAAARVHVRPRRDGFVEALVLGRDRPGFFADVAGAIVDAGASVREAQILPAGASDALDLFILERPGGLTIDDAAWLEKLRTRLESAAAKGLERPPRPPQVLGDRRHVFVVRPNVRFDLDGSEDYTIVEAEGRDRPGLLYHLARALSDVGAMIAAARVATYGERAVDTFYVFDAPGYKITNRRRLQSLERRLLNALGDE